VKLIIIAAMAAALLSGNAMAKSHPHHRTAHRSHPVKICPTATRENSGWIGEDADSDGYVDRVWRVYLTGFCAGEAVKP